MKDQMEPAEKESIKAAAEDISREFKTLVNSEDLDSIRQLQHLMYVYTPSLPLVCSDIVALVYALCRFLYSLI